MSKVQRSSSSGTVLRMGALILCAAMAVASCEHPEPQADDTRDRGRFGDGYQILTNEHPDAPHEPPAIESDTLYIQVSYGGGCEEHDFDLDYDTSRDTTRLWIHHNGRGDSCEALIYERMSFRLPEKALANRTMLLLNPNDDTPFVLRWGR